MLVKVPNRCVPSGLHWADRFENYGLKEKRLWYFLENPEMVEKKNKLDALEIKNIPIRTIFKSLNEHFSKGFSFSKLAEKRVL